MSLWYTRRSPIRVSSWYARRIHLQPRYNFPPGLAYTEFDYERARWVITYSPYQYGGREHAFKIAREKAGVA